MTLSLLNRYAYCSPKTRATTVEFPVKERRPNDFPESWLGLCIVSDISSKEGTQPGAGPAVNPQSESILQLVTLRDKIKSSLVQRVTRTLVRVATVRLYFGFFIFTTILPLATHSAGPCPAQPPAVFGQLNPTSVRITTDRGLFATASTPS